MSYETNIVDLEHQSLPTPTKTIRCCDRCDISDETRLITVYYLDDAGNHVDLCRKCTNLLIAFVGKEVLEKFVGRKLPVKTLRAIDYENRK